MKFNKKIWSIIFIALLGGVFYSCQDEDEMSVDIESLSTNNVYPDEGGMMKLGKQLENPYTVANMKKAFNELKSSNSLKSTSINDDIEATHFYIKFKPDSEEELDILKSDSTLVLYDYPLDYEIESGGDYYHDLSISAEKPTFQYCAVEINKKLPEGVNYDILEELYIPYEDEDDESQLKSGSLDQLDWQLLEDKALEITGNLEDVNQVGSTLKRRKWRPAGTVKVYDDVVKKFVPVVGIEVRARRWFTTHEGITNNDGVYSCN